eukprot:Em0008g916a
MNFESGLISELCKLLETRSTQYHPQSDGMIERFNRTLLGMLSSEILEEERNWEQIQSPSCKTDGDLVQLHCLAHHEAPQKHLVVHFNCLKPYLLSDRDAPEEGTEQLRKQKQDDEKDYSFPDKERREGCLDSETDEGEVINEINRWSLQRVILRQSMVKMRHLVNLLLRREGQPGFEDRQISSDTCM